MNDNGAIVPLIGNYIKQANFLTSSVFVNLTEAQKDTIYFLMRHIDFHSKEPSDTIYIDFREFLAYKEIKRNNYYSSDEMVKIIKGLLSPNGHFINQITGQEVYFNIIDNVEQTVEDADVFKIKLAEYGNIFFYEKNLIDYVQKSKALQLFRNSKYGSGFTQIEKNVITLKSLAQKRLFELLSQYKFTGWLKISLIDLKLALGFITFEKKSDATDEEHQLKLIFSNSEEQNYIKHEKLKQWRDFKKSFLDPAIKEINNNLKLDITNLSYETFKYGRNISSIKFTFKRIVNEDNLSEDEKSCVSIFSNYGLKPKQIYFIMTRIGYENMYAQFKKRVKWERDKVKGYVYYDSEKGNEIHNLSGFLYEEVFPELKNSSTL